MTLYNIATNNIKKNFKNYWAYFLSTTFSIFVIYLFLSIINNKNVVTQLGSMNKFIILFKISSYLIAFFSVFFIWYSNSFFIKSRKKEFATYMLLGMTKNQTFKLNLIENTILMILAFFCGIGLGVIFNKFFVMLLFTMIKTSGVVKFQFCFKAFKYCFFLFAVVFILISIHSKYLINSSNLIDLFNASKKAEKGLKVSIFTFIISILSVVFLGYGYYLAAEKLAVNFVLAPEVVLLVVIGTILFMIGTVSTIIYIAKKNEKKLFYGTRLISTSQLFYRYKGNVGTLSVIGITTTIALCAMVTCFGLFSKTIDNSRYMRPFSVEYLNSDNAQNVFKKVIKKHNEISIKSEDSFEILKVSAENPFNNSDSEFYVINVSEFNKINSHEGIDRKASLIKDYDCYYIQTQNFAADNKALGKTISLPVKNTTLKLSITATDNKPFLAMDHFKQTLILKDSLYNEIKKSVSKENTLSIKGYMLKNDFMARGFVSELLKEMPKEAEALTFYDHYMDGTKLMGMMAFIGIFIGLTFLTATGSIIYFKMVMEAKEDKSKFITLMKIGVSKKEIKSAVSKELLVFFGLPFIIATISSYAASVALGKMLSFKLADSYIFIILIYALLYSIYYFISINSYMKDVCQ